jgi:hypothetical protein
VSEEVAVAAVDYAARGWPVLPLHWPARIGDTPICSCPRGLQCASPAKHPLTEHGLHDASTDPVFVGEWWRRWPRANPGVVTGVAFDVLDIDDDAELARLVREQGDVPLEGPTALTGHGAHLLLAPTGGGNRARFLHGCDWRGRSGYIVAPPSLHITGRRYTWLEDGPDTPIRPAPAWLLELVRGRPVPIRKGPVAPVANGRGAYGRAALADEVERVAFATEGCRNETLNRAAFDLGQLVAAGYLTVRVVGDALLDAAVRSGLAEAEAEPTIRSGLAGGARHPRRAS